MADERIWKDNVGQIFLSNEAECFWLFPKDFYFNKRLCITSPWFTHEDNTWRLVKTPVDEHTMHQNAQHYVSIYLWKKVRQNPLPYEYTFELKMKSLDRLPSILCQRKATINSDVGAEFIAFCNLLEIKKFIVYSCTLIKLHFVLKKKLCIADVLPSTTTTLEEDDSRSDSEEPEKTETPEVKGIERLTHNLKQLLLNEQNSDFILKVQDREFPVHKTILAARSEVFSSMFQHDMVENKSGVVDIPDCTAESFQVFLLYLYTGSAETMSPKNVFNLYYAADKYRVDDLKEECVEYMMGILSVESFCDVIALALRHGEHKLQKEATRFFRENIKQIIKTALWQKYMSENSTHANELLIKALNA